MFRKWKQRCSQLAFELQCEQAITANLVQERDSLICKNAEMNSRLIRLECEVKALRESQKMVFPPKPLPREPISRR